MIGTKIDNLEVIAVISEEGWFGKVYKVKDHHDNHEKAIKIFRTEKGTVEETRFKTENDILYKLQPHENIIMPLSKILTFNQYIYYVLELADYNLRNYIVCKQDLPITKRLEIFNQICEGLKHAHSKQIVHRDLHECNVLIKLNDQTDIAKLTDFGKARDFLFPSATAPCTIWGNLATTAPEVISQVTNVSLPFPRQASVDFFSLGIILSCLFQLLSPFFSGGIIVLYEIANQKGIYLPKTSLTEKVSFYKYCIDYFEKNLSKYLEVTIPTEEMLNDKINELIREMSEPDFSGRLCNFDEIQSRVQTLIDATKHV